MLNNKLEGRKPIPGKRRGNPLTTISGLIKESARIYRLAKKGRMSHEEARSLVWILVQVRTLIESGHLEELHAKLGEFTAMADNRHVINGEPVRNPPAIEAH